MEDNRKLALFLNYTECIEDFKIDNILTENRYWITSNGLRVNNLDFDSNWNRLMEVVEKIESIYSEHHGYFGVYINSNGCTIQGTNLHLAIRQNSNYGDVYYSESILGTKIESTFNSVLIFINWYNNDFKIETINQLMVKFIGMEKDEVFNICKNENIRYRTTKQDGRSFIITCDYNTSRFNFEIENNIITKCNLG